MPIHRLHVSPFLTHACLCCMFCVCVCCVAVENNFNSLEINAFTGNRIVMCITIIHITPHHAIHVTTKMTAWHWLVWLVLGRSVGRTVQKQLTTLTLEKNKNILADHKTRTFTFAGMADDWFRRSKRTIEMALNRLVWVATSSRTLTVHSIMMVDVAHQHRRCYWQSEDNTMTLGKTYGIGSWFLLSNQRSSTNAIGSFVSLIRQL